MPTVFYGPFWMRAHHPLPQRRCLPQWRPPLDGAASATLDETTSQQAANLDSILDQVAPLILALTSPWDRNSSAFGRKTHRCLADHPRPSCLPRWLGTPSLITLLTCWSSLLLHLIRRWHPPCLPTVRLHTPWPHTSGNVTVTTVVHAKPPGSTTSTLFIHVRRYFDISFQKFRR